MPVDMVNATVKAAEYDFENQSARIERCKVLGIDYERAVTYLPVVQQLNRAMDPRSQFRVELQDNPTKVRIIIGNVQESRNNHQRGLFCPLCLSNKHQIRMCPFVHEDLREMMTV